MIGEALAKPIETGAIQPPRKRKLLEERAAKKMRQFGKVDIPQEAFIAALKVDS